MATTKDNLAKRREELMRARSESTSISRPIIASKTQLAKNAAERKAKINEQNQREAERLDRTSKIRERIPSPKDGMATIRPFVVSPQATTPDSKEATLPKNELVQPIATATTTAKNSAQQLQQQNQSAAENGLRNTTAGRVKQGSVAPEQAIQPQAKQTPEPQPLVITPKDDSVLTAAEAAAERNRIATDTQAALTQNHPEEVKRLNYEAMTKMLNEQGEQGRAKKAEDEEKRRRRKQLFNAIGDGVAALSNLYFTTQGAPSVQYDPRGSLSARSQARWDAIDANRKAEEEKAYVLQQQAMDKALKEAKERRDEQRQAERDRIADERYKEERARQDRQRAEDVAYREAQVQRDEERWKAQLAAQEKNTQATEAGLNYRAKLSADTQAAKTEASTAKAKRGKPMQFSDGKNTVSIYENVWKPSMQQVYDAMVADGVEDKTLKYGATAAQIENFVKQNWTKSAKAKDLMKILSKIDPAAEYSNVEDEDYSQYEVGNEEDYSQYEVK